MEIKNKTSDTDNSEAVISQEKLLQFFGTAVHDIKAPFRNIGSYLDIIKSKTEDCNGSVDLAPYFNRINTARDKITVLLEELMKFVKTSTAKPVITPIDLQTIISDLTENVHDAEISVQGEMPQVKADAGMIKDLLQSLLSNAKKFKKEEPLKIKISVEKKDNYVQLHISDNGMGIEEKYFPKIFEPFERLNSPDEFPGAGLGLTICKLIAEKHGGKIEVTSEYEKGSTFTVMLPAH